MKTLRLSVLAVVCLGASAQTVQVIDTILSPFSSIPYSGVLVITGPDQLTCGTSTIRLWRNQLNVTAGALNLALYPNIGCLPTNTSYRVEYIPKSGERYTERWVVPAGPGPYKIKDVVAYNVPSPTIVVAGGGVGGNSFSKMFANVTSLLILASEHTFSTSDLIVQCFDNEGDPFEPGLITVNSASRDITVTFQPATSGRCVVSGGNLHFSQPFTTLGTVVIPATAHGMRSITGLACYDTAGQQFQTGAVTFTPSVVDAGGTMGASYDISISITPATSGRCVVLGS